MSFWVDALVKGTALLIVIFGLAAVSGRWSAATRHLLWCFGLGGLLALPVLSSVTPWHLPVLPPVEGVTVEDLVVPDRVLQIGVPPVRIDLLTSVPGSRSTRPGRATWWWRLRARASPFSAAPT